MPSVLITGANRGIGLEFARQYAAEGWRVHATCRAPTKADKLRKLAGDVVVHRLDVRKEAQLAALADRLGGEALDLLINNAGISARGSDKFGRIDFAVWEDVLRVNTLAPVRLAEAFADHVARSERKLMVALTSRMGSISENGSGYIAYRSSKAALNAAMRVLATELGGRGITVVVFHPGWVRTDMGTLAAPVSAKKSVRGMRAVIDRLTPRDSSKFFDYQGQEVPW